jgi:exo-poly-alpha-galacturonosidase
MVKTFSIISLAFVSLLPFGDKGNHLTAKRHYLITDNGAIGDGKTLNTTAIQKTIDQAAAAEGGGIVEVPEGTFITGSIFLKQGVNLLIDAKGVLKGSLNPADYPQIKTSFEGVARLYTAALINAQYLADFDITGEGTIDGSGEDYIAVYRAITTIPKPGKPRLICLEGCHGVTISKLKLHNQAVWCLHLLYCKGVKVDGLTITAEHNIPSSDGIDIDQCDGVTVSHCDIDVNDDCISIKAGRETNTVPNRICQNIIIQNTRFGYGHGGVAMGSETSGGIKNVEVRDCVAEGNWAPVRFKSQQSRGGTVQHIVFRNFKLVNTTRAFEFNMNWTSSHGTLSAPSNPLPIIRDVQLINVSGTAKSAGSMAGLNGSPISNVKFVDCNIEAQTGLRVTNVTNIDYSGLTLNVKQGEKIIEQPIAVKENE